MRLDSTLQHLNSKINDKQKFNMYLVTVNTVTLFKKYTTLTQQQNRYNANRELFINKTTTDMKQKLYDKKLIGTYMITMYANFTQYPQVNFFNKNSL